MSRGDGSESSPVSFHGSLKVDFEPVSVKLGLIATTGATHSAHTHSRGKKNGAFPDSRAEGCCCTLKERPFFMVDEAV